MELLLVVLAVEIVPVAYRLVDDEGRASAEDLPYTEVVGCLFVVLVVDAV